MTEMTQGMDLAAVRADTPGVRHRNHLNNAGAALMPTPVLAAVTDHLRRESEIGGYEAAAEATDRLARVHASVARLIGAGADEIAMTENATVAWQRAFQSLSFAPGDRILTTTAEFAGNYIPLLQLAGRFAITWLPTNGGLVNPAAAVGRIAKAHSIPYLLDACQAVGQMPIEVDVLGCDILVATGRKFLRGPRGTGFLYMARSLLDRTEPALLDLFRAVVDQPGRYEMRADARRFETWETNYSTRLGLGVAADYAPAIGLEAIGTRCVLLGGMLRERLAELPPATLRDAGTNLSAIVSFTVGHVEASAVMQRLTALGINVSVSPPTSTPLDAAARSLPAVVRASPH